MQSILNCLLGAVEGIIGQSHFINLKM
uniref:Uncharacterized protein n=1 Tax=Anguilla anguilla TaxID=7936 RepID=A0A0E9UXM0_ANGAN